MKSQMYNIFYVGPKIEPCGILVTFAVTLMIN